MAILSCCLIFCLSPKMTRHSLKYWRLFINPSVIVLPLSHWLKIECVVVTLFIAKAGTWHVNCSWKDLCPMTCYWVGMLDTRVANLFSSTAKKQSTQTTGIAPPLVDKRYCNHYFRLAPVPFFIWANQEQLIGILYFTRDGLYLRESLWVFSSCCLMLCLFRL